MPVPLRLVQHFERSADRQTSTDQRQKLLVEYKKRFEFCLAPARSTARFDTEYVITGMGKTRAQLFSSGSRVHLFLYASTFIGQLDDELCHNVPAGIPGSPKLSPISRVTVPIGR